MSLLKIIKDRILKSFVGADVVPRELFDLHEYFRLFGNINFEQKQESDGIVAVSTNFRHGSIVTSGRNQQELDKNIRDAILTSFDVPSAYANEAQIYRVGEARAHEYALS